jgi:hypothetical protein
MIGALTLRSSSAIAGLVLLCLAVAPQIMAADPKPTPFNRHDPALVKTREQMEALLPNAVFDENKDLVDIYWATFHFHGAKVRLRDPKAGDRLVERFADRGL